MTDVSEAVVDNDDWSPLEVTPPPKKEGDDEDKPERWSPLYIAKKYVSDIKQCVAYMPGHGWYYKHSPNKSSDSTWHPDENDTKIKGSVTSYCTANHQSTDLKNRNEILEQMRVFNTVPLSRWDCDDWVVADAAGRIWPLDPNRDRKKNNRITLRLGVKVATSGVPPKLFISCLRRWLPEGDDEVFNYFSLYLGSLLTGSTADEILMAMTAVSYTHLTLPTTPYV